MRLGIQMSQIFIYWVFSFVFEGYQSSDLFTSLSSQSPNTSYPEPRDPWTKHDGQIQDWSASCMPLSTPNHSPIPGAGTSLLDTWPGVLSSKGSSNSWGNWNRVKNKLWQWPWQLFSPQPARAPHANVTSLSTILKIRMWEAEINALPASAT